MNRDKAIEYLEKQPDIIVLYKNLDHVMITHNPETVDDEEDFYECDIYNILYGSSVYRNIGRVFSGSKPNTDVTKLYIRMKNVEYEVIYDSRRPKHGQSCFFINYNFVYKNLVDEYSGHISQPAGIVVNEDILLLNADMDNTGMGYAVDDIPRQNDKRMRRFEVTEVSFRCLSHSCLLSNPEINLLSIEYFHALYRMIQDKNLNLIDFSDSERIARSENWKDAPAGFTYIGNSMWHKAPSVLFYNKILDEYIVMGFDDEQYFSCNFKADEEIDSLQKGYYYLAPEEVRGENYTLKPHTRQGEWFFIPIDIDDVDDLYTYNIHHNTYNYNDHGFILPRDSEESNKHRLTGKYTIYIKDEDIIVKPTNDSPVFIKHDDHNTVTLIKPTIIVKNVAIRNFSVDGVD